MERMVINTTAMRNTASEFGTEISEWHGLVEQIWAAMSELDAMWDGDANTAFNTLIAEDKPKFTQLERMMEEYKNAITRQPKARSRASSPRACKRQSSVSQLD